MGRDSTHETRVTPEMVQAYLRRAGHPDAEIRALRPLGQSTQADLKSYGYGHPLRATFTSGGSTQDVVIRTMSPDPFGHNRRSARAEALMLAFDTFNDVPRHIEAYDVGAFGKDGSMIPMGPGELFLVTNYVDGDLYANDLHILQDGGAAAPVDIERAEALARYLAELHSEPRDAEEYRRTIRDTVGSGEGIFGLCESYPRGSALAPKERLRRIEDMAVDWRWKLIDRTDRCRRTHGDFHPFNILFRDKSDFSILDCSRGAAGEPADDLTCLSINYVFFTITKRAAFEGGLRTLWDAFWHTYLETSGDDEVLDVVAPFFAWRALVLASPVWYPNVEDPVRERLFRFAERLLGGELFRPQAIDALIA
jgi:aminoglycoside phosphotransferase (APT) family kinase protein